jgi:hypothetical protein
LSQIVGAGYDSAGKQVWFLFDDDRYFKITGLPNNAEWHGPWGINDKAELAGAYRERIVCKGCGTYGEDTWKFISHSFIAVPCR